MQTCEYETDCRERQRQHPGHFDEDGDCSWCVLGIMEHCDLREPSGIYECPHPRLYLDWGDDFPGDRDDPGAAHTVHCIKCHEKAERERSKP